MDVFLFLLLEHNMRVLTFESPDKKQQIIEEISYDDLLLKLKEDHGWHEVINGFNQNTQVRVYFDLDSHILTSNSRIHLVPDTKDSTLRQVLEEISMIFKCSSDDWAISDGCREDRISYHIMSKLYRISIKELRRITYNLHAKFPSIDYSVVCISMNSINDLLFFRLPNQHKGAVNKPAPPMKIIQGELKDFIVTWTEGLKECIV